jgi:hypothetical protein
VTSHDQLFKDLVVNFFADLVRLMAPRLARRLRPESATWLRGEVHTDLPEGARRELDLVAEVPAREGEPELVLVHVEIEAAARPGIGRRMWRYGMQLRLRHERPVLPLVLFLAGGPRGIAWRTERERLWEVELTRFRYLAWGIGGSTAERFVRRPEPLAWALAGLMRPRRWRPARHKLECLRRIAHADLDDARRFLLANCVQTYLQLEASEQESYRSLREHVDDEEVREMEMTWAEKMTEKGRVEGMRNLVLHLAERRWGGLDEVTRQRIEAIDSTASLESLHDRLLTAASPEEAGLA